MPYIVNGCKYSSALAYSRLQQWKPRSARETVEKLCPVASKEHRRVRPQTPSDEEDFDSSDDSNSSEESEDSEIVVIKKRAIVCLKKIEAVEKLLRERPGVCLKKIEAAEQLLREVREQHQDSASEDEDESSLMESSDSSESSFVCLKRKGKQPAKMTPKAPRCLKIAENESSSTDSSDYEESSVVSVICLKEKGKEPAKMTPTVRKCLKIPDDESSSAEEFSTESSEPESSEPESSELECSEPDNSESENSKPESSELQNSESENSESEGSVSSVVVCLNKKGRDRANKTAPQPKYIPAYHFSAVQTAPTAAFPWTAHPVTMRRGQPATAHRADQPSATPFNLPGMGAPAFRKQQPNVVNQGHRGYGRQLLRQDATSSRERSAVRDGRSGDHHVTTGSRRVVGPNGEDLSQKHWCSSCSSLRSDCYHQRYPPGGEQPPAHDVCGRCVRPESNVAARSEAMRVEAKQRIWDEAKQKEEEARRLREHEARRKEEEARRRRKDEARRKEEEARQREEEFRRRGVTLVHTCSDYLVAGLG
ncbi:hypothetical protein B0H66DRAFT_59253 [Apodospora peruviana]|uniref:Uncharacterized protein n=1 Tax=Apodospora peruviana TaxID=516989 RepID=A0AAE0ISF2_9PEZI|nr:hypothetical protein B0H66DRAFT_59253 [Apodospora peruviana]